MFGGREEAPLKATAPGVQTAMILCALHIAAGCAYSRNESNRQTHPARTLKNISELPWSSVAEQWMIVQQVTYRRSNECRVSFKRCRRTRCTSSLGRLQFSDNRFRKNINSNIDFFIYLLEK